MTKISSLFFLIIIILFEYGCSPGAILASGGASTMIIAEDDRTAGDVIDDATIKVKITAKFIASDESLFLDLDSTVIEGRVLLTGIVTNQEARIEAVRLVWEVVGVQEVINEIQVGQKTTIKEYANDMWITAQIKAVTTKNIGLRSLSYNFETIRGKVYIAGITSRKEQLDIVIESIESIKGVKEIVNYVVLKE